MPDVPAALFVNGGRTDFDSVLVIDDDFVKHEVKLLFDNDLLSHPFTKSHEANASFENYWKIYRTSWRRCDLNMDDRFELFFNGIVNFQDSMEILEIYVLKDIDYEAVYSSQGRLLAYKIQPFTKEIILYHHQYPCCESASHNINAIRIIDDKINLRKKYFVARPDMKGVFFPKAVMFDDQYEYLQNKTKLYWSGGVINRDAWTRRTPSNVICRYKKETAYKVLAIEDGWKFVLMNGGPIQEDSRVINTSNFIDVKIFGWIRE